MSLEKTLQLAKKIASDNYSRQELDQFLAYMDNAETGEVDLILNTYREALDKQDSYPLYVNADFIHRLKALRPDAKSAAPELPVIGQRARTGSQCESCLDAAYFLCRSFIDLRFMSRSISLFFAIRNK